MGAVGDWAKKTTAGRIVTGVATMGMSEAGGARSLYEKAYGYDPLNPGTVDPLAPPAAPPPPPDLADEIAKRANLAKQQRLMNSGSGTFLTGPLGDVGKAPAAAGGR